MWVSTFHSACVRILRAEHEHAGLKSTFSIYDADDSRRLMQMVGRELDLDPKRHPPRKLAAQVSNLKNELIDAGRPRPRRQAATEQRTVAEAYALYQRRLREAHALDFDDLIMTTVQLLQSHPEVAEHYRRRFRHVLVDEYQDTNHAQYVLVKELVGGGATPASCAWSATPTSRSTPSAAPRSATSSSSSATIPTRARSCWSRTTARPRRSSPRPTR